MEGTTIIGVEDFPNQEKKPFFPKATVVDPFLPGKGDTQTLLDIIAPTAGNFTNALEAILNQTVPADFEDPILVRRSPIQNAIEESVPRLASHLPPRLVF